VSRARTLATLAALGTVALASTGSASAAQPLLGQYPSPPRVSVESRGITVQAGSGSYCWSTWYDDDTGRGFCVDKVGPIVSAPLPVRGKRIVRIDLGIPAKDLTASLSEQTLRIRRGDPSGRYWALRLPRRLPPTSLLSLGASFSQGSLGYGVSLSRVKR
jgi:hypothetical protein